MYCRSLAVYTALGVLRDIKHRPFQGWFSFLLGCTQLKTDQVDFEGPVEKLLLAVPNRSQKAKGRFYSFQRWQPHPLGCDCLFQWSSNFREPWLPSKFYCRILNISWHLGYAISRQSYLVKASSRAPQRIAPLAPKGGEGPVWETLVLSNS